MTPLSPAAGTIYLITDGRHIKVGWTSSTVESRLAQLQTGNVLELSVLSTVTAAGMRDEALFHRYLLDNGYLVRGEWFRRCEPMVLSFYKNDHASEVFEDLGICLRKTAFSATECRALSFGERLKQMRVNMNMTQRMLAAKAGVSYGLIWQYESGMVTEPKGNTAQKLAVPLGVHPGELLFGIPTPQPEPAE